MASIGHPGEGAITLDVNGARRQEGDLNQMIWKVSEMIAVLSEYFMLRPRDLIMTGTPSGVGAGRRCHARSGWPASARSPWRWSNRPSRRKRNS
jgi:fumarylpyruvate hydrolase